MAGDLESPGRPIDLLNRMDQPPLSTCHQDQRSWSTVRLSLLTLSILCHSDFVKSHSTVEKKLKNSGNCQEGLR